MSLLRARRGAGVFDYAIGLALVAGLAAIAANAFAKGQEETLRFEGACVKTFTCEKGHAAPNARSLAPEERHGVAAAWQGVRAEADISVSELDEAVRSPADVVRGVTFILDHPSIAAEAIFSRNAGRPPEPGASESGAEEGGRIATRVATSVTLASLGRVAKIGAMVGRSGKIDWDVPPPPPAPEDPVAGPAGPSAGVAPPAADAGAR